MKKSILRVLVLVLIAALFLGAQSVAFAEESAKPFLPTESAFPYKSDPDASNGYGLVIQNYTEDTVLKKVKSSDPSVVKASWTKKDGECLNIQLQKPGTATISGVIYQGGKKVGSFKTKATVYKYESPVKSFKLGSTDYAKEFKNKDQYYLTLKKTKTLKVSIKPASGWKLSWIEFYEGEDVKEIKNNTKVTFRNSWNYVNVFFYNEKLGRDESVVIYVQK